MKSTIFLCWAGSSIKSVPRTYSANFAGSEASSGVMSPSVETARLRADDRAGQEEIAIYDRGIAHVWKTGGGLLQS